MARNTELSKLRPPLQLGVSFESARECASCVGHPSVVAPATPCGCGGAKRALPSYITRVAVLAAASLGPTELVRRSNRAAPVRPLASPCGGERRRGTGDASRLRGRVAESP